MEYLESPYSQITMSLSFLKRQEIMYLGRVNGGILKDHFISLQHGLEFLKIFLDVSENEDLIQRIKYSVAYVKQKLYLIQLDGLGESLFMNLEYAFADLRRVMKDVIMKTGTNEYDIIFPKIFISQNHYLTASSFLCEKIRKLVTSVCKADRITPVVNELELIKKMLTSLLEPFFIYAKDVDRPLTENEEEEKIFAIFSGVIDRAACFIYFFFVGKMDDEMVLFVKNSLSDLIIEESQIMEMYLTLDIDCTGSLKSHISMSLRLLEWNEKCYLGTSVGATLEDHFMSIKHGLQFLDMIMEISTNTDLKRCIQHLVAIVKRKLHSLPNNQKDEYLIVNLDHAYGELRGEMQNVVMKLGADEYDMLFPEILQEGISFSITKSFLLAKINELLTSSCKADQMAPMMEELEELRKTLTSLEPLIDNVKYIPGPLVMKEEEKKIYATLTNLLDRSTCLLYLFFVGKFNAEMLLLVKNSFFFLIEETEIEEMCHVLGINCRKDLDFDTSLLLLSTDIDTSLSLLKRQEEYHKGTINEAMLEDHIMSLEYALEFLKWLPEISRNRDLVRRIMLLAGNVKQKLETIEYTQGGESLDMDVNRAYIDLREEMKSIVNKPGTDKFDTLFSGLYNWMSYFRENNDFLLEKIMTLMTSNCKAEQIATLMKELQDLQKMLTSLKPLCLYIEYGKSCKGDREKILQFHNKATCLIYLSLIGKMDIEMGLFVKSNISTTVKESDVSEMYSVILNEVLFGHHYLERELYLLENLILLLESLNDANSKLFAVLIDMHCFLLGVHPNVLFRKLHLLQASFQAILGHSIPVVCSFYLQNTEVDVSAELNCILDQINYIKSEAQQIKLYFYPRTDDFGFLEFFLGYLEDLMKTQEISVKEEIDALHFEVHSLISLAKIITQEELNGAQWTGIMNMAYQAEYLIDLYLVSSSSDLGLISSLSKIIYQLKNIRADLHGICCKSLPTQDVAVTSNPQVHPTDTSR